MPGSTQQELQAGFPTRELDTQILRGARRPYALEGTGQLVDAQRWVLLVPVEQFESPDEPSLVRFREAAERLEELPGQSQRPELVDRLALYPPRRATRFEITRTKPVDAAGLDVRQRALQRRDRGWRVRPAILRRY